MKALAASTSVWWWVMIMLMVATPSSAMEQEEAEVGKQLVGGFTNVTFETKNGLTAYSNFLTRLRNAVEAPSRACGLQSTRSTPLPDKGYVYVNLQISNTEWVTLGIDVTTLYVWGYESNVKYNGSYRATFLNDTPTAAKNSLFPGAIKRTTKFGGNYAGAGNKGLESAAGVTRETLTLGISSLEGAIRNVYGKQESELDKGKAEAKFFLISIQMVAEAARFKYMEQGIVAENKTQAFKTKMIQLQNNWGKISNAIHLAEAAKPKCGTFSQSLQVGTTVYKTVDSIKNDIGILKYYNATGLSITSSILADDIVHLGGLDGFLASTFV